MEPTGGAGRGDAHGADARLPVPPHLSLVADQHDVWMVDVDEVFTQDLPGA